jgi:hypothetical protein
VRKPPECLKLVSNILEASLFPKKEPIIHCKGFQTSYASYASLTHNIADATAKQVAAKDSPLDTLTHHLLTIHPSYTPKEEAVVIQK